MTTLLIDADTLAYTAALGAEYNHEWEGGVISRGADVEGAFEAFKSDVEHLAEEHNASSVKIALTGPENFRKDVYPLYKSKRGPKPIALSQLKQLVVERLGGVIKHRLEADDVVGIWATHPSLIKGEKVVYSIDKDLKTIPCRLIGKDGFELTIDARTASYNFLTQVLTGDVTDGYPGCPGVGPKGAAKILDPVRNDKPLHRWMAVLGAFERRGLSAEDALVQARVARILRHTDYNFKTKEPILWQPPTIQ